MDEKKWGHPVDDCIAPLADYLRSVMTSVPRPRIERLWWDMASKHIELGVKDCVNWLEFHIGPEYAKTFSEKVEGPLERLISLEFRMRLSGYSTLPGRPNGDKLSREQRLDLEGELEEIFLGFHRSIPYLRQLGDMLGNEQGGSKGTTDSASEDWLTNSQASDIYVHELGKSGVKAGANARSTISKACTNREIISKGEGLGRRIDPDDFRKYISRKKARKTDREADDDHFHVG